jgi:hypothetical protein
VYPYGLPSEVVVCELHPGELADGHSEWVMGGRLVGAKCRKATIIRVNR